MPLRQQAMRRRLTAMSALSSSFALLLACAAFLAYELVTFRKALVNDLTTNAQLFAANVASPLLFDDARAAAASLEALKAKPSIRSATLTSKDGTVFARYGQTNLGPTGPPQVPMPYRFEGDSLFLSVPVLSDGSLIGTLTLESSLEQRDRRVRQYLLLTASVLVVAFLAALGIASRMRRPILQPIVRLTDAARQVSRNSDYSVRVETSDEGELGALSATFNDMLGKIEQQAAELRKESEQRFRLLVDGVKDYAIVMLDPEGRIVSWNQGAERLTGFQASDIIGKHFSAFHLPEDVESGKPQRELQTAVSEGRFEDESQRIRKDGSRFWAHVVITALRTEQGRLRGFGKVTRDVTAHKKVETERKLLEHKMQEANRLKSEFLANMSHELRTPLNAIIGFAELMHSGKVGALAAEHHEYLGDILISSRHLLRLINDILDLAKVESGKMEFRPERVDLGMLIGEVRDILRELAARKGLHLDAQVDPEVKTAVVDPARLKQVLYNYLSNAIKFTPEGGRVTIRVAPHGPDLFRLDVEDTGIGISPEDLGKLFVEFQQLDASPAKKYQGTGLGLALTKRIIEAHGGRIDVRSALGQGSTFSAILPREGAPAPRREPAQTSAVT